LSQTPPFAGTRSCRLWPHTTNCLNSQIGIALTYYLFIATNVNDLLIYATGRAVSVSTIVWLQVSLQVPLSWIRHIHYLEPTTMIADVGIVFGLVAILCVCAVKIVREGSTLGSQPAFNPVDYPLFVGTSVFCFEGLALTIPLQEALQPRHHARFPAFYFKVQSLARSLARSSF
jgi:proton-coupled amino acid transporter